MGLWAIVGKEGGGELLGKQWGEHLFLVFVERV